MDQRVITQFLDTSRRYLTEKGKRIMENTIPEKPNGILYPLMVIAGVSVTVFSLLGTAAITGYLPSAHSTPVEAKAQPPGKDDSGSDAARQPAIHKAYRVASAPACRNCGTVTAVNTTQERGQGTGLGAVAGGVAGAVVGNQMGNGNGRTAMTILGAGGGAYLGNEIEKSTRSTTHYTVTVRMNDGSYRTLHRATPPSVEIGQKVRVDGNALYPANLT